MIRLGLDTNILAYLGGLDLDPGDAAKIENIWALVDRLRSRATIVVPVQAFGELFVVMVRNGSGRAAAREIVANMSRDVELAPSTGELLSEAMDLVVNHRFQYWDALIYSATIGAGCAIFLSEDMHHGFTHGGTTIINPFAETPHPRLAELLAD